MSEETKAKKNNNKLTIILVVLVFVIPLPLSWYVFNYTDFLEVRGMSNKGELIDPPRAIANLALVDPLNNERQDSLHGKWSLAYVADVCDKACMDNVYRMRQIHMSMDKHSLRVQKVLFLTEQSASDIKEMLIDFRGQQIIDTGMIDINELLKKFQLNESFNTLDAHRLYIIDPLGNLMMSYKPDANPRDIYKDLKKLLRGSRIG
jgi:cytochrome oxidase Cu insertion factor (SCO1/SenC/PrrC family)